MKLYVIYTCIYNVHIYIYLYVICIFIIMVKLYATDILFEHISIVLFCIHVYLCVGVTVDTPDYQSVVKFTLADVLEDVSGVTIVESSTVSPSKPTDGFLSINGANSPNSEHSIQLYNLEAAELVITTLR